MPFVRCLICYGDAGCSRVDKAFDEGETVAFDSRIGRKITRKGLSRDKGKKYGILGTHLGVAWRELGSWNASESVEGWNSLLILNFPDIESPFFQIFPRFFYIFFNIWNWKRLDWYFTNLCLQVNCKKFYNNVYWILFYRL